MLLWVPRGDTALCDMLRDSPLEEHAFPRLLGDILAGGLQASKARMSSADSGSWFHPSLSPAFSGCSDREL